MLTNRLRIGTRGSLLARTQTEAVAELLRAAHPELVITIEIIHTTGDMNRDVPFAQVGTKGMFVKEIEEALLSDAIDVGVHSLKDMPAELPTGLVLACVPIREDPLDALLSRSGIGMSALPYGAVVGTSSIRRQAQLRAVRPDLQLAELRGNLDTRLRKLDEGQYEAIVLACAGLNRLGLANRITERLSPMTCVPAVGQGALALETRAEDAASRALLAAIHDGDAADSVEAERGFQFSLNGGCSVPAGALATLDGNVISLRAVIAAPDGSCLLQEIGTASRADARALGMRVAETLLTRGGRDILKG
jgi:hydroxymethylbilane synthase